VSATDIRYLDTPPPGWAELCDRNPDATLYHHPEWHRLVERRFGHRTGYLALYDQQRLAAALPVSDFRSRLFGHRGVSLPYVNYGGPLWDDEPALERLLAGVADLNREQGWRSTELRMQRRVGTGLVERAHKVTFRLPLPNDSEALLKSFKAKLRSQIKRPSKDGMTARHGGAELLDDFYPVYCRIMRDLGSPPLPLGFFADILQAFPRRAFVVAVRSSEGRPVAGSVLLCHGTNLEIPWASALREHNRSSPNMLLYWESMRVAIELGCGYFDFGRCTPGGGTWRFKRQWGAKEVPLYWYYALAAGEQPPQVDKHNPKFETLVKVWRRLPLWLTNSIGPRLLRHIP
jgi:FemAB-related protein (PEP-CTERM system-associated)